MTLKLIILVKTSYHLPLIFFLNPVGASNYSAHWQMIRELTLLRGQQLSNYVTNQKLRRVHNLDHVGVTIYVGIHIIKIYFVIKVYSKCKID